MIISKGISIENLAQKYYLSVDTIRKNFIYKIKNRRFSLINKD